MKKLITFTVPCFNSASYMAKCLDSLLACGSDAELDIIIVDDGSTDRTGEIAEAYAARHPAAVRAIHQPNSGHGEGVNQGIRLAQGLYFKVVDSDDWLDGASAVKLLAEMREQAALPDPVDLFIGNYVYEHVSDNKQRFMRFNNVLPTDRIFSWREIRSFGLSQYLGMHTLYYKTAILRQSGIVLPQHTFYVDNLFAYIPLPWVRTLRYLDLDLYRYFIGRADQSISEANLIKRIDQHILVVQLLIEAYDQKAIAELDKKLQRYMRNFIRIMMATVVAIALLSRQKANFAKIERLWLLLKARHPHWYVKIRHISFVALMDIPCPLGQKVIVLGYRIAQKIFKFN